jgi:hypothetical protein
MGIQNRNNYQENCKKGEMINIVKVCFLSTLEMVCIHSRLEFMAVSYNMKSLPFFWVCASPFGCLKQVRVVRQVKKENGTTSTFQKYSFTIFTTHSVPKRLKICLNLNVSRHDLIYRYI